MSYHDQFTASCRESDGDSAAFTLIELLAVLAIVVLVIAPVCSAARDSNRVGAAVNEIADALETAASYARVNNSYAWVGFFEEDAGAPPAVPARAGAGRVVVSVVASKDGSRIVDPSGTGTDLDSGRLVQLGKLLRFENMHIADLSSPSTPDAFGGGDAFDARPDVKTLHVTYRIGASTPARGTIFPFSYPVGTANAPAQYKFAKVIQFRPNGEAILNTSYSLVPWIEIGVQPAHGSLADDKNANVAAIQVSGVTGCVRIYRP